MGMCDGTNLVIAKPNFLVDEGEGEDVVDERFGFSCLWWDAEYLDRSTNSSIPWIVLRVLLGETHMCEHLLRQFPPLRLLERLVKAQ